MTWIRSALARLPGRVSCPPRHPFIIWLATSIAVALFQPAFGIISLPGSLERLPALLGQIGAASLWVGAMSILIGQLWGIGKLPGRRRGGLIWETGGLICMTIGSGVYSYALASSATESQRSVAYGQSMGFVSGCVAYLIWIVLYLRGGKTRPPDQP